MAEGKNKFILYTDYLEDFEDLEDCELGTVMRWVFSYVNDENPDMPEERALRLVCKRIKRDLQRDLKNWKDKVETNRINGAKGGRPKKQTVNQETEKTERFFEKPKKADKDKDKDKVKDNDKDKDKPSLPISSEQVETLLQTHLTYWNVPPSNERLKMDVWRWLTDEVDDLGYLAKQLTHFMTHTDRKYQGTIRNWMSYKWNETDYETQGKIIEDADTKYYTYDEMLTIHNDPKKELKQKDFEIVHEKTDHKNRKLWKRKAS